MLHAVMIISTASGMALYVRKLTSDSIAHPDLVGGLLAPITESAERSIGLMLSALTLGDGRAVSLARDDEYKVLCAVFHGRAPNAIDGYTFNGSHGAGSGRIKSGNEADIAGATAPAVVLERNAAAVACSPLDDVEETARAEMGRFAAEAILSAFLDAHGEDPGGSQSGLYGGFPAFTAQLRPALMSSARPLLESLVAHRSGAIRRAVLVVNANGGGGGRVLADTLDREKRNGSSSSHNSEAAARGGRMKSMRMADPLALIASIEALMSARAHLAASSPHTRTSSEVPSSLNRSVVREVSVAAAAAPSGAPPTLAPGTSSSGPASTDDLLIDGGHGERLMVRQLIPSHVGPDCCATLVLVLRQKVDPAAYQPSIDQVAAATALLVAAANDNRLI